VTDSVPDFVAFLPQPRDRKRLSTARSSMVTAEQAFANYLEDVGRTDATCWAVSVGDAEEFKVPAYGDGGYYGQRDCHASLYFGGKQKKQSRSASKLLAECATKYGCAYDPDRRGIWGSVIHVLRARWSWFQRVVLRRR
jgi:hypothetical protein